MNLRGQPEAPSQWLRTQNIQKEGKSTPLPHRPRYRKSPRNVPVDINGGKDVRVQQPDPGNGTGPKTKSPQHRKHVFVRHAIKSLRLVETDQSTRDVLVDRVIENRPNKPKALNDGPARDSTGLIPANNIPNPPPPRGIRLQIAFDTIL